MSAPTKKLYYFMIEQGDYDNDDRVFQYYIPYHFIPYRLLDQLKTLLENTTHFRFIDKGYLPEQLPNPDISTNPSIYILDSNLVTEKDMKRFIDIFSNCQPISYIESLWYMGDINFSSPNYGCGNCNFCNPPTCKHTCPSCCKN